MVINKIPDKVEISKMTNNIPKSRAFFCDSMNGI